MNKFSVTLSLIPLLASVSVNVQAGDAAKGKQLVETHCQRCHGSEVYTRPDRRVTSLEGLHKQVRRCDQMLGMTWFDDDIDNAATYLNQEFYKFKK